MQGILIAIEGTDAAGKATQAKLLAQRIATLGRQAVIYSFPQYDTPIGQMIERHLKGKTVLAETMQVPRGALTDIVLSSPAPDDPLWFQCACAIQKYVAFGEIIDHLRAGRVVICDRWKPSARAFGQADGLDPALLDQIQDRLPDAGLNIFISVSEAEALRRRPDMRDRYERDREKQKVIRDNYTELWGARMLSATEPNLWIVIDGEGPIETVHARIWEQVANAEASLR